MAKNEQFNRKIGRRGLLAVIAVCCVIFAGIRIYRSWIRPHDNPAMDAYSSVLSGQASEAARFLNRGASVVVLAFETEAKSPVNRSLRSMIETLKADGLSVRHVEYLRFDPQRGWSMTTPGFPYEEFLRVAREYPGIDAMISFCGAPYLRPTTERPDPGSLPLLLIPRLVERTRGLGELLAEGRVALALTQARGRASATESNPTAAPASKFNVKYEVLTAKNVVLSDMTDEEGDMGQ